MEIVRCSKGHFYDSEENATCPMCAAEAARNKNPISIPGDPHISAENSAIIAYDNEDRVFYFGPSTGRNIVRVNGKPALNAAQLEAYDVLTIGTTKLLFVPLCGDRFDWNEKK